MDGVEDFKQGIWAGLGKLSLCKPPNKNIYVKKNRIIASFSLTRQIDNISLLLSYPNFTLTITLFQLLTHTLYYKYLSKSCIMNLSLIQHLPQPAVYLEFSYRANFWCCPLGLNKKNVFDPNRTNLELFGPIREGDVPLVPLEYAFYTNTKLLLP